MEIEERLKEHENQFNFSTVKQKYQPYLLSNVRKWKMWYSH